jgi:hypothetical protein
VWSSQLKTAKCTLPEYVEGERRRREEIPYVGPPIISLSIREIERRVLGGTSTTAVHAFTRTLSVSLSLEIE